MSFIREDLAPRRRWRGNKSGPEGRLSRETDRALDARLALARLMYGGHAR